MSIVEVLRQRKKEDEFCLFLGFHPSPFLELKELSNIIKSSVVSFCIGIFCENEFSLYLRKPLPTG